MAERGPGILVAVGGGEDKRDDMRILRRALEHVPEHARRVATAASEDQDASRRRVAIIPTASREPVEAARPYLAAFRELGAQHIDVVDIRSRGEAAREEHVGRLRKADLIYMTGGDQARLTDLLAGTPAHEVLRAKLASGGVVAGTSAGAAAMSATMIAQGQPTMRKGHVRLTEGLGLMPRVILDTHFTERGRFGRLLEAVASQPGLIGMGLAEDTAIVYSDHAFEVVGRGHVIIVDGRQIRYTDHADVAHDQPVSVENVIVHTLTEGRAFRLDPPVVPPLRVRQGRRARA